MNCNKLLCARNTEGGEAGAKAPRVTEPVVLRPAKAGGALFSIFLSFFKNSF